MADVSELVALLAPGGVTVLSGAGLSTESGIPDYRGPDSARRRITPMTFQMFTRDATARHRYWARAYVGYATMADARPNRGHEAVAQLQAAGIIRAVITQNVDGLHQAAGSHGVIDLHGRLDRVICLGCGERTSRASVQQRLAVVNEGWHAPSAVINPDGDANVDGSALDGFTMVDCAACGGILKPDVVYFGERVPATAVAHAQSAVADGQTLLILGSSLHVYSGRRFALQAAKAGIPIAIINVGPTRADDIATVRIDAPLGQTLTALATALSGADVVPAG